MCPQQPTCCRRRWVAASRFLVVHHNVHHAANFFINGMKADLSVICAVHQSAANAVLKNCIARLVRYRRSLAPVAFPPSLGVAFSAADTCALSARS